MSDFHGYLPEPIFASELAEHISTALLRTPLISHQPEQKIQHVAWCSGGAQNYLQQAIEYGVDAYISGEVSEHTIHTARENNVVFMLLVITRQSDMAESVGRVVTTTIQ